MNKHTFKEKDALQKLITLEKDARDFGFDWSDHKMLYDQTLSESKEVIAAIQGREGDERVQEEIGDLIHTAISWCCFAGYDVEETLAKTSKKFARRMHALRSIAKEKGLETLKGKPMPYLLELWEEAKRSSS